MGEKLTIIELNQQILRCDQHIEDLEVEILNLRKTFAGFKRSAGCIDPMLADPESVKAGKFSLNCDCPATCGGFND